MTKQTSEDSHVHFEDVKPNIPDFDYMSLWESFKKEYIPQATSSPIKQVFSCKKNKGRKLCPKSLSQVV